MDNSVPRGFLALYTFRIAADPSWISLSRVKTTCSLVVLNILKLEFTMLFKSLMIAVVTGLASLGGYGLSAGKSSCCFPGAACCDQNLPCCTTEACCYPGAECCELGLPCCETQSCCVEGAGCCDASEACCAATPAVKVSAKVKSCCASGADCCDAAAACCPAK